MVINNYIPDRGDLVWVNFNPQRGHEQSGKRPALVLSPLEYNKKTGLALMCPITSQIKGYPFEVIIKEKKIVGAIIADQVRSLDWQERRVKFIQKIKSEALNETQEKLCCLLK
ncbi:MAG: endoribonuclease MazF [Candidatus Falkowbacteria bacterium]|nr:endoribonuclease MazF [Candidatus Falkowbacteria bacterium]